MPTYDSTQMIRDDRDLREVVKEIWKNAKNLDDDELPPQPGVYGLLLNEGSSLPGIHCHELIYIGKSIDLARRGHFKTGNTRRSTLRRTLGAVLKQTLDLRSHARSKNNFSHYCFHASGEEKLTDWMDSNLRIGFSVVIDNVAEIERRLIRYCEPVLNLTHWANPQAGDIRALRAACVEDARKNGLLPRQSS